MVYFLVYSYIEDYTIQKEGLVKCTANTAVKKYQKVLLFAVFVEKKDKIHPGGPPV